MNPSNEHEEHETPESLPEAVAEAPTPAEVAEAQDVYSDQPVHAAPAPSDLESLKPLLEAILMAAGRPMTVDHLHDLFGDSQSPGKERILEALASLMSDCAGRGVELIEVASGFRYQVRTDTQIWVSRLWTERQTKYSRALLETLALIAYRQPITRAEIEAIRGVAVSSYIIKTLEEREWIRVLGHRDVPGRPALFGTTRQFLDYFSLKSLDQLPPLAELRDFDALEPQMPLAGTTLDEVPVPDVVVDNTAAVVPEEVIEDEVDEDEFESQEDVAPEAEDGDAHAFSEPNTDLVVNDDVEHLHEDLSGQPEDIERADPVDPNQDTGTTP
ncbi:MAG: SMC-Scp complex subunit ScpB [Ahniella sp.]|nr:SMC-Scp complex subunit ScpB [Ahniella sp.]